MSVALRLVMSKLTPLLLLSFLGCIDPADDATTDGATYTRTIVRFADDGSQTVTTEPIAAAEQQLDPRTVGTDSCGDWNATKFFDQPSYTGNELCLIGDGTAYLHSYCRSRLWPRGGCIATWSQATRSLWTGTNVTWILAVWGAPACPGGFWTGIPAYEAEATVDACVQAGDEVTLIPQ